MASYLIRSGLLVVFLLVLYEANVNCFPQTGPRVGNPCELSDNTTGICTPIEKCNWIQTQLKKKKITTNDITQCFFENASDKSIVCCPQTSTQDAFKEPEPEATVPSNEENVGDRVDTVAENVASVTNTTNDSNISDSDDSNSSTTIKLNVNTVTETEEQSSELPVNENRNETVESRLSEDTDKKIIFKNEKDCRGKNNYLFLDAIGQENKLATVCANYLFASATNQWNDPISFHITDGVPVFNPAEFPHIVALGSQPELIRDRGYEFRCGGVIISEEYILTAAHCIESGRRIPVRVRVGTVNANETNEIYLKNISKITIHPEYDALTVVNDIALIRLTEPLIFSSIVQPACLYPYSNELEHETDLEIAGWGGTEPQTEKPSDILRKGSVASNELTRCNSTLIEYNKGALHPRLANGLNKGQICAFDRKTYTDTCRGDSGGPLQLINRHPVAMVIGLTSFGIECGTPYPSVYTRIPYYAKWIERIVWPEVQSRSQTV